MHCMKEGHKRQCGHVLLKYYSAASQCMTQKAVLFSLTHPVNKSTNISISAKFTWLQLAKKEQSSKFIIETTLLLEIASFEDF